MAWEDVKGTARVVSDSKGKSHYVIFQELNMSCGPASVAMVESQYKLSCMVNPEKRAREISQQYEGSWTAEGGTMADNLSRILNAEGVKAYDVTYAPPGEIEGYIDAYLTDRTLMIFHIAWTSGGHFAVLRKKYSDGTMVFLDPWYGVVEMKASKIPVYKVPGGTGKLSGWMNITYK